MSKEKISVEFTELELSAIHGLIQRYERNSSDNELPDLLYNLREKVRSEVIPKSWEDFEKDKDEKTGAEGGVE